MGDFVYVYTDKSGIIQEISMESRGDLLDSELSVILKDKAVEVLDLYEKLTRNQNMKKNTFVLVNDIDEFKVEKTLFVYYHYKDKSIKSLTPRKQQNMDDDETLLCGLVVMDSLVKEFIDGTKNMLNYCIDDSGVLAQIEEIAPKETENNFLDCIPLLSDFVLEDVNEDGSINIEYDGLMLHINTTAELGDVKYQLFFVHPTDSTVIYSSIEFDFKDGKSLDIPIELPTNIRVVSPMKKIMKFDRTYS